MRLTIKGTAIIDCGGTIASLGWEEYNKRYSEQLVKSHIKLSQLEDIEEELSIDLLTLIRALKNGIYLKLDNDDLKEPLFIDQFRITRLHSGEILLTFSDTQLKPRHFKDYGKTWALTEEELKDEKNC